MFCKPLKNLLSIIFILLCTTISLRAQQLFGEIFTAYNLTHYSHTDYQDQVGYFPIGFKLAGGHEHIQAGFELHKTVTEPAFEISNNAVDIRHEFEETYYGMFLRGNV